MFSRPLSHLFLLVGPLGLQATQVDAQARTPPSGTPPKAPIAVDSSNVYTYVERMPVYPNGDMQAITTDFQREFRNASATSGCSPPSRVFVSFVVGPSGVVYDVKSINNQLAYQNLPKLSAACEAAVVAAGSKLSRFSPGMQNRRRVAVTMTLKLEDGTP